MYERPIIANPILQHLNWSRYKSMFLSIYKSSYGMNN